MVGPQGRREQRGSVLTPVHGDARAYEYTTASPLTLAPTPRSKQSLIVESRDGGAGESAATDNKPAPGQPELAVDPASEPARQQNGQAPTPISAMQLDTGKAEDVAQVIRRACTVQSAEEGSMARAPRCRPPVTHRRWGV